MAVKKTMLLHLNKRWLLQVELVSVRFKIIRSDGNKDNDLFKSPEKNPKGIVNSANRLWLHMCGKPAFLSLFLSIPQCAELVNQTSFQAVSHYDQSLDLIRFLI